MLLVLTVRLGSFALQFRARRLEAARPKARGLLAEASYPEP